MTDFSKLFSVENLDYFLSPKETGYDMPKTMLYALLLVAAAYGIYKILKKLKIKIDKRLAVAVSPYVVLGSVLRVMKDVGIVDSYLFVTPTIYVFVFAITFISIAASYIIQKKFKIPYYKTCFVIGVLILPFVMSELYLENLYGGAIVALFMLPWLAALLCRRIKWALENKIVTLVHIFDATTTFVSLNFFGYYEQHIVPTALINALGPFSFVVIKAVVIVVTLYMIDRLSDDIEFNNYIKLIIGILGAATGTRDFVSLLALV